MKRKFEQFNINNEYIDECAKKFNNSDKDKQLQQQSPPPTEWNILFGGI